MGGRHIRLIAVLLILVALVGGLGWTVYAPIRQERLNRAFIAAIKQNDMKKALVLLDEGADPNARDEPSQHVSLWRLLLDRLRGKRPAPLKAPTALVIAVEGPVPENLPSSSNKALSNWVVNEHVSVPSPENPPLVEALLDYGAWINVPDSKGATPLLLAMKAGYTDTAKLLLDNGADANQPDAKGTTPLMYAAFDDPDIISSLLDHGAKVNLRDQDGWTALTYADNNGDLGLIKRLLDSGADINNTDKDGTTTLCAVIQEGKDVPYSPQIVRLLLDRGANINVRDGDGETLLMAAVEMGEVDIVRILIKRGANLSLKSSDGETALALARRVLRENKDDPDDPTYNAAALIQVIKLLKQAGAKE